MSGITLADLRALLKERPELAIEALAERLAPDMAADEVEQKPAQKVGEGPTKTRRLRRSSVTIGIPRPTVRPTDLQRHKARRILRNLGLV